MKRSKYKRILVFLLVMVFSHQIFAVDASCSSMPKTSESFASASSMHMHGTDGMDHTAHLAAMDAIAETNALSDCCSDCECSPGHCSSYLMLSEVFELALPATPSLENLFKENLLKPFKLSYLRPPIFR